MLIAAVVALVTVVGVLWAVIGAVFGILYKKLTVVDGKQEKRIAALERRLEEQGEELNGCNEDRQCLREALVAAGIAIPERSRSRRDGG